MRPVAVWGNFAGPMATSLHELQSDLGRRASEALVAALGPSEKIPNELPIVKAGKPEFGDYQISACLQLAKTLGKPPRELAKIVEGALAGHAALAKVEIAGPGFINLHVDDAWLGAAAAAL